MTGGVLPKIAGFLDGKAGDETQDLFFVQLFYKQAHVETKPSRRRQI